MVHRILVLLFTAGTVNWLKHVRSKIRSTLRKMAPKKSASLLTMLNKPPDNDVGLRPSMDSVDWSLQRLALWPPENKAVLSTLDAHAAQKEWDPFPAPIG